MGVLTSLTAKAKLESAGLSRIWQYTQDYYCGTISAFRQYRKGWADLSKKEQSDIKNIKKFHIPYAENMKRHRVLGGLLLAKQIQYIRIDGVYQESETEKLKKESSYFCFATFDFLKRLLELGKSFEQDSITYAKPKENFNLIAATPHYSNEFGRFFKSGEIIVTFDKGNKFGDKVSDDFYSRIRGRPFAWDGWNITKTGTPVLTSSSKRLAYDRTLYPTERRYRDISLRAFIHNISTNKDINEIVVKAQKADIL